MTPSTEQLSQWILDEILRLKIARHQGFSAHEVVAAVIAKHLGPFYPEGEATRRPVEKELFPLAAKVIQRHFDPESVIEEQAAGREPSEVRAELKEPRLTASPRAPFDAAQE
jgi:hypothetical protein